MRKTSCAALAIALIASFAFTVANPGHANPTPVAHKLNIVHLGDSYSAGNGAGQYHGPPGCQRSRLNWGSNFANWVNSQGISATYTNRACSGGVVDDILKPRTLDPQATKYVSANSAEEAYAKLEQADACGARAGDDVKEVNYNITKNNSWFPRGKEYSYRCQLTLHPQAHYVGDHTDLVVMTMGGNDVGFKDIVTSCFAPFVPGVTSGANAVACRREVNEARDLMPGMMFRLKSTIETLLKERMTGNPTSKVVLLSYPLLATDRQFLLRHDGIAVDAAREVRSLGFEALEQQRLLVADLNQAFPGRVVLVADSPLAFAQHEPDPRLGVANPYRWINEFAETEGDLTKSGTTDASWSFEATNFWHPNRIGHRELAKLVQNAGVTANAPLLTAAGADIDVVFTIGATGSMGDDIQAIQNSLSRIVEEIDAQAATARFAVVTYQDHPAAGGGQGDSPAKVELDFTTDLAALQAAIEGIQLNSAGDSAESVYSGVDAGLSLSWRPGVRKTMLMLGDAPPKDPEPVTGLTWQALADRANSVDPVVIYAVDTGEAAESELNSLVEATGGSVLTADGSAEIPDLFVAAATQVISQPFAWIQGPYVARLGSEITLDARGSNSPGGQVTSFEWDFDGDGTYDQTTTEGVVTHQYDTEITGHIEVRVTDDAGQQTVARANLMITRDGDPIPDDFDNCVDVANPTQQDLDADGVGDECQEQNHFSVLPPQDLVTEAPNPGTPGTPRPSPPETGR